MELYPYSPLYLGQGQIYFHEVSCEMYLLLPVDIRVHVEPVNFRRTIIIQ